jgi:ubiquinone/menaquinone biosynthesis C-methylase UbiE
MGTEPGAGGGWVESAPAYIEFQDRGDPNRTLLLDPVMLRLCGEVAGKRVLDLGCGDGRFCRMLSERGATVIGLDLVREMVATGHARRQGDEHFVQASAEVLPFGARVFDLVVSYITMVDFPDFRAAIRESARVLRPGGEFLIANLHFPTAAPDPSVLPQAGWIRDAEGRRLYRPIDNYMQERSQVYSWTGITIRNWHRPLSAYMQAYLDSGLQLREFIEPVPPDDSLRDDPQLEDWYRVPEFLVLKWQKGEGRRA